MQFNHYLLGDMESDVLNLDRGRAVHADATRGMDYWVEHNFTDIKGLSIQNLADATSQLKADMVSNTTLARAHEAAVIWRKERSELPMEQETFRSLYGRLLMSTVSRQVTKQEAQFMTSFALRDRES